MDDGDEHLTRRIEYLLELRLRGGFTPDDAAELRELYLIERRWRLADAPASAIDDPPPGLAHDLHPAGRFRRPPAPLPDRAVERRCQLCGAPERESQLMRLDVATPTRHHEQLVCDNCIRAGEAMHEAGSPFPPRGRNGAIG